MHADVLTDPWEALASPAPGTAPTAESAPGAQVNIKRFDAFQGASPCNQTAALGGQRFAGDLATWMAGGPAHPLAHYTLRSWLPYWAGQGKCMVHPDHMAAYQVRGLAPTAEPCLLDLALRRLPSWMQSGDGRGTCTGHPDRRAAPPCTCTSRAFSLHMVRNARLEPHLASLRPCSFLLCLQQPCSLTQAQPRTLQYAASNYQADRPAGDLGPYAAVRGRAGALWHGDAGRRGAAQPQRPVRPDRRAGARGLRRVAARGEPVCRAPALRGGRPRHGMAVDPGHHPGPGVRAGGWSMALAVLASACGLRRRAARHGPVCRAPSPAMAPRGTQGCWTSTVGLTSYIDKVDRLYASVRFKQSMNGNGKHGLNLLFGRTP